MGLLGCRTITRNPGLNSTSEPSSRGGLSGRIHRVRPGLMNSPESIGVTRKDDSTNL